MNAIWHDEGAWIALGVTVITLIAALVMHRIFVKILRSPPPDRDEKLSKNES
ncbi:MAG: hypothetical protein LBI48_12635 [Burkholderiaceae bacterium]|jgi:hypothetical protein|nr:hypothetical protein [Burkholderiaceae bacterium]